MSNKGNEDSLHQPTSQQQAIDQATNANLHGEGSNFPTNICIYIPVTYLTTNLHCIFILSLNLGR